MKKIIFALLILVSIASAASMNQTVSAGDEFTIEIMANTSGAVGYQFDFKFPAELGHVTSVTEGTLFQQYGDTFFGSGTIDNENGTVSNIFNVLIGETEVPAGEGSLATIHMVAGNKSGYYYVTTDNVLYIDPNGQTLLPDEFGTMILVNSAPVLVEPVVNLTIDAGCFLHHQFNVVDPDGDTVYLFLDFLNPSPAPAGVTLNSSTQTLKWTPTAEQVGIYYVGLLISDSWQDYWANFTITVLPAGSGGGVPGGSDYPPWDVNKDGTVNIQDLVLVARNIGQPYVASYDVNMDGAVNVADLVLIANNFEG